MSAEIIDFPRLGGGAVLITQTNSGMYEVTPYKLGRADKLAWSFDDFSVAFEWAEDVAERTGSTVDILCDVPSANAEGAA